MIISLWYNEYMVIHEILWPADRVEHVAAHNITPEEFEEVCFGQSLILRTKSSGQNIETMNKKTSIPQTDSIEELARFWDTHDGTDFADELEEVTEPVFVHPGAATVTIELPTEDFAALQQLAQEEQVDATTLLRTWVREKRYYAELIRHARQASQHSA